MCVLFRIMLSSRRSGELKNWPKKENNKGIETFLLYIYSMKILTKKPKNSNENQKKAKSKNEKAKREGIFLFHRIKFIFYHVSQ